MSNEIYNPPTATLTDSAVETTRTEFYVISKKKFLLLFMSTLGLYQLYWLYRNWKLQKSATALDVIPLLRAAFQVFFFHSLFRRIDHRLRQRGKRFYWHPDSYATALVALTIISSVADRFAEKFDTHPLVQLASIALLPVIAFAYLPAQEAINQCCDDPDGSSNNALTLGNYAWLSAGAIIWTIIAFGMVVMLSEPAPQ